MTTAEFETFIQSGFIVGVAIIDRESFGEGFELFGFGDCDNKSTHQYVKQAGFCVTDDSGKRLHWPDVYAILDFVFDAGWRQRVKVAVIG